MPLRKSARIAIVVAMIAATLALGVERAALACAAPVVNCGGLTEPRVANFSPNAVVFRPNAVGGDTHILGADGVTRDEIVVDPVDGLLRPATQLAAGTLYTLVFDDTCIPIVNGQAPFDPTPGVPAEFVFFVAPSPAPEPTGAIGTVSIAEQSKLFPGTSQERYHLTLALNLSEQVAPHVGRLDVFLQRGDRPWGNLLWVAVSAQFTAEFDVDCAGSQPYLDSCHGILALPQGVHRMYYSGRFVGGTREWMQPDAPPTPPLFFDLTIDCRDLASGKTARIVHVSEGAPPTPLPDAGSDAMLTPDSSSGDVPGPDSGSGGCAVTGIPRGSASSVGWLLILSSLLVGRRVRAHRQVVGASPVYSGDAV